MSSYWVWRIMYCGILDSSGMFVIVGYCVLIILWDKRPAAIGSSMKRRDHHTYQSPAMKCVMRQKRMATLCRHVLC